MDFVYYVFIQKKRERKGKKKTEMLTESVFDEIIGTAEDKI